MDIAAPTLKENNSWLQGHRQRAYDHILGAFFSDFVLGRQVYMLRVCAPGFQKCMNPFEMNVWLEEDDYLVIITSNSISTP